MSWEISWALCRACMDTDSELFPLYNDVELNKTDLSNQLAEIAEIEISKADGLPTKLCEQCILQITACCKFKKLVQESDRKLRNIITEFSYDSKNNQIEDGAEEQIEAEAKDQTENQMKKHMELEMDNQIKKELGDEIKNHVEKQLEHKVEIQIEKELVDEMENQMEKQSEDEVEDEVENWTEKPLEEHPEITMKIKYIESEIEGKESYIFNSEDENSTDNIEEHCLQQLNPVIEKEMENSIDNSDNLSDELIFHDIVRSNEWKILSSIEKSDIDMENNSAQSVPIVKNEEVQKQKSIRKTERKRKIPTKPKRKKKKIEEKDEMSTLGTKETNKNSSSSDVDSSTENANNIVGSLNDRITRVKEIRESGKDTSYQCTLCLQNYPVLSDALLHIVDWHVPANGPFYCVVCEKDCENIKQLKKHVKIHKGDNPYICFLCNKAYTMKRYLKRHMVCHIDFPRHRCTKCGQRFNIKTDLEAHAKSHIQMVAFKCSQCSRVFNHKGNYKRHLISHLDPQGMHIPKYPCDICNKRFINNRTLRNHKRIHTGERPFKCEICDKAFSQKGNLLNHAKVHTNPRGFACEICGRKFNQKATLKDHFKLHTGEKSYVCTECGEAFTFSAALGRHMWSHRDRKPFACDMCEATFVGSYDLKRHTKTHSSNSKRKQKPKQENKDNIVDFSKEVIDIVQENTNGNTIVIEQLFVCDDSIQIISHEESGKENADSLLCLL